MHDANARGCRRRRAASAARNGSFTLRRCPITATSKLRCARYGREDAAAPPTGARREPFAEISPARASRELLQCDEPVGACERVQSRRRIAIDVFIDVGAAQGDDQGSIRVKLAKAPDAVRAAPRVQRNHQIRGGSVVSIGDVNVDARARAGSAPSAPLVVPFPDRDDERVGVIITIFMNEPSYTGLPAAPQPTSWPLSCATCARVRVASRTICRPNS